MSMQVKKYFVLELVCLPEHFPYDFLSILNVAAVCWQGLWTEMEIIRRQ